MYIKIWWFSYRARAINLQVLAFLVFKNYFKLYKFKVNEITRCYNTFLDI